MSNSEKYNECNDDKDGYCIFEKNADDLYQETKSLKETLEKIKKLTISKIHKTEFGTVTHFITVKEIQNILDKIQSETVTIPPLKQALDKLYTVTKKCNLCHKNMVGLLCEKHKKTHKEIFAIFGDELD